MPHIYAKQYHPKIGFTLWLYARRLELPLMWRKDIHKLFDLAEPLTEIFADDDFPCCRECFLMELAAFDKQYAKLATRFHSKFFDPELIDWNKVSRDAYVNLVSLDLIEPL